MTNVLVGSGPLALRPAANLPNIEYHDTDNDVVWRADGVNWFIVAGSTTARNPMRGPGDLAAGGQEGVPVRVPAATADDLVLMSQASAPGGMAFKAGGGASTLAALTDVTVTSPQEGDLLKYTSGKWENAAGALVSVAKLTITDTQIKHLLGTPLTLVTPSAGTVIVPIAMSAICDFRNGAYTDPDVGFNAGDTEVDGANLGNQSYFSSFAISDDGLNPAPGAALFSLFTIAKASNGSIPYFPEALIYHKVGTTNEFTGGGAGNTLTIILYYLNPAI